MSKIRSVTICQTKSNVRRSLSDRKRKRLSKRILNCKSSKKATRLSLKDLTDFMRRS